MALYSPFERTIDNLQVADLGALKQAVEGWYIEYKVQVPSASSIAKSISAFANSYGGWLFYGIDEKSKEEPVAGAFPGIPQKELAGNMHRITQAVATALNPPPSYEHRILNGPCQEIELSPEHSIICIRVPQSNSAPHVHRSGQIYRRVADSSEPKPETDRFLLQQLFQRGERLRQFYADWIDLDPTFSKGEADQPYIRLLLVADLWRDRNAQSNISLKRFREIVRHKNGTFNSVPFDTAYSSANGFVARQLKNNDRFNLTLTWLFRPDLRSEIIIPLRLMDHREIELSGQSQSGYKYSGRFGKLLNSGRDRSSRIVDLNYLYSVLVAIIDIQNQLLEEARWAYGYFMKIKLLNVWRTIPFLDVEAVLGHFEDYGIPMCLYSSVTTPDGNDADTFYDLTRKFDPDPSNSDETTSNEPAPLDTNDGEPALDAARTKTVVQAYLTFIWIAQVFGITLLEGEDSEISLLVESQELLNVGTRAMEEQARRLK